MAPICPGRLLEDAGDHREALMAQKLDSGDGASHKLYEVAVHGIAPP